MNSLVWKHGTIQDKIRVFEKHEELIPQHTSLRYLEHSGEMKQNCSKMLSLESTEE